MAGLRVVSKLTCLLPEQFDYALRKKGVEKMIVIVRVPTLVDQLTRPGPAVTPCNAILSKA